MPEAAGEGLEMKQILCSRLRQKRGPSKSLPRKQVDLRWTRYKPQKADEQIPEENKPAQQCLLVGNDIPVFLRLLLSPVRGHVTEPQPVSAKGMDIAAESGLQREPLCLPEPTPPLIGRVILESGSSSVKWVEDVSERLALIDEHERYLLRHVPNTACGIMK